MSTRKTSRKKLILQSLDLAPNISYALRYANVSPNLFYRWKDKDPKFAEAVESALQKHLDNFEVAVFSDAYDSDSKTQMSSIKWLLSRLWREKYGNQVKVVEVETEVPVDNNWLITYD